MRTDYSSIHRKKKKSKTSPILITILILAVCGVVSEIKVPPILEGITSFIEHKEVKRVKEVGIPQSDAYAGMVEANNTEFVEEEYRDMEELIYEYDLQTNDFYYNQLSNPQKTVYNQLKEGLLNFQTRVYTDCISVEEARTVVHALKFDNPDIFWAVEKNLSINSVDGICIYINIIIPSGVEEEYRLINQISDDIVEAAPQGSEYEKAKYLYDYLVNNTCYSHEERDQDVRSVFIDRASVCNGYAFAYTLLCKKAGLQCATVVGMAKERHAWNLLYIDGVPYWVDVTWGDYSPNDDFSEIKRRLHYLYFCSSDNELFKTHQVDPALGYTGGRIWSYPNCLSDEYSYYRMNGLMFEGFDADAFSEYLWLTLMETNPAIIEMKFTSADAYNAAVTNLCEGSMIHNMLQKRGYVGYYDTYYYTMDENWYLQLNIELLGDSSF